MMTLPAFRYHPDPLATGSIVASEAVCACCQERRGYIYAGPVYAEEELRDSLCPWCIAGGRAHAELGASFTDEGLIGGNGAWDLVPASVIEEVAYRTPGFIGWQQEMWWTHCGDAAQFLGHAGRPELEAYGAQAVAAIREFSGLGDGEDWQILFEALEKNGAPTAYIFRCLHCGALGGYQDSD